MLPHEAEVAAAIATKYRIQLEAMTALGEFVFFARNPRTTSIPWRAHQRFADGSTADWIGPAGDRRPASIVRLTVS